MKVIKQGTLPEEKIHRQSCSYCKSELEFKQAECEHSPDPRDRNLWFVKCPVCNHDVWVQQ